MCWWGIWTLAVAPALGGVHSSSARSAQLAALVSPLLTMLYVHASQCNASSNHTLT